MLRDRRLKPVDKENDTVLQMTIQEADRIDVGSGCARMSEGSMKKLSVNEADIIEIESKHRAFAKCITSHKGGDDMAIHADGIIRSNAGTSIGEIVQVRKAKEKPVHATKIFITLLEDALSAEAIQQLDINTIANFFRDGDYPIIKRDRIAVSYYGQILWFLIVDAIPVVNEDTPLLLSRETTFNVIR